MNPIGSEQNRVVSLPLVSIIIPTYNRKHLLVEAVQSCLDQTWRNIEVIVVDDGSTDGTDAFAERQIAGSWAGRVQYHKQENAGASAARNRGLELARGEYVQFLDSDDILLKDKISLQIAQLESGDGKPDGCSCTGRLGRSAQDLGATRQIGIRCETPKEYIRRMCLGVVHGMSTPAPLWRRSFLISRPGWRTDISLGDDFEYYLRLLAEAKSMAFVEQDLFLVREHDGPHLSDAKNNRAATLSAIRTHRAVVETVREAGMWDTGIQAGILRTARTLYANILACGTSDDIQEIEQWLWALASESRSRWFLRSVMLLRKAIGTRLFLKATSTYLAVRKGV